MTAAFLFHDRFFSMGAMGRKTILRPSASGLRRSAFPGFALASLLAATAFSAHAQVAIKDAWVRGTVPGQRSSGAFLVMTSKEDAKVVAVSSPVAKVAEIHETKNDRGMMVMEHVPSLALPAGKAVEFKPGGHHVMLMGIEKPLGKGQWVPITFTFEDAKGKRSTLEVKAAVRPLGR